MLQPPQRLTDTHNLGLPFPFGSPPITLAEMTPHLLMQSSFHSYILQFCLLMTAPLLSFECTPKSFLLLSLIKRFLNWSDGSGWDCHGLIAAGN